MRTIFTVNILAVIPVQTVKTQIKVLLKAIWSGFFYGDCHSLNTFRLTCSLLGAELKEVKALKYLKCVTCSLKHIQTMKLEILMLPPFQHPNCKFANSLDNYCIKSPITKTCLYNVDPLKPQFYIVKLGFTGVYIILLISAQNIDCGYSLEPPRRGNSNEYPQSMFWAEIWKIFEFLSENFSFFGGKIFRFQMTWVTLPYSAYWQQ